MDPPHPTGGDLRGCDRAAPAGPGGRRAVLHPARARAAAGGGCRGPVRAVRGAGRPGPAAAGLPARQRRGWRGLRVRPDRGRRAVPGHGESPPQGVVEGRPGREREARAQHVVLRRPVRARVAPSRAHHPVNAPILLRRAVAELIGTGFLVAAVVGSGIAAQRLSADDVGLQLLENSLATGAVLVALILALQPVSASFNPVVTLVERALGRVETATAAVLVAAQVVGGLVGVVVANLMYDLDAVTVSTTDRGGSGQLLGEVVATVGLVLVVFGALRSERIETVAFAVGGYIAAAYWFTSSTSFANPAVTIARTLSDTFAGIAPGSAPTFVAMQLLGGAIGLAAVLVLFPQIENAP